MKNISLLSVLSIFLLSSSYLQAGSIVLDDLTVDFPGYNTGFGDENGTPRIQSMTITWDDSDNSLLSVSINLSSVGDQLFDSLFINTDATTSWDSWDYLVHTGGSDNAGYSTGTVPDDGLYEVDASYAYTLVTTGVGGRTGHPNGIDSSDLSLLDSTFTGDYDNNLTISYDFSNLSTVITLGDTVSFAYTPWCANDVILVSFSTDPVPEPATMLLFGAGIAGLAGFKRRKSNK